MEYKPPSRAKKILINIVLLFMLIIFPAMSWYYLNSGANFYRGIMKSLGEYGNMPAFQLNEPDGTLVTDKKYDKKLSVVNFSDTQGKEPSFDGMKYVYDQFIDNPDVLFLTIESSVRDSVTFGSEIIEQGIDPVKWSFAFGDSSEVASLRNDAFIMPDSLEKIVGTIDQALILVDTNNVIRNYYLSSDSTQLNKMITTMSLLMPRDEKASIKFEREKEK